MTQKQIRQKKELLLGRIEAAKIELEALRNECTHPQEEEVNYSWRIGCVNRAFVCVDCGEFLRYKDLDFRFKVVTNLDNYGLKNLD